MKLSHQLKCHVEKSSFFYKFLFKIHTNFSVCISSWASEGFIIIMPQINGDPNKGLNFTTHFIKNTIISYVT